ncbi:hypothetical protein Poly30_20760 [Planctomycetes bacterium Poly30]|uniref:Uncharacterized protein n=1 Tax=Saltatorellus ferox TaxID=2528018 RepID=A0A518ER42_9BACT|nr:hypothetical protein Poly30_20760 [Planctomycetes bacterium Poly30]
MIGRWERCCSSSALRPGLGSLRFQVGTYPPQARSSAPGTVGRISPILSFGVHQDSQRKDPMLNSLTHTANAHPAIEGGVIVLLASTMDEGACAVRLAGSSLGSEQGVQGPRPLDELPARGRQSDCVDGTMKGPAVLGCLGGGVPMVRPARVGICAGSRMEEWTLRSLWGQRHGLGSQREGDVRLAGDWESSAPAAPRVAGFGRGPNRRGETTASSGAV